MSDKRDVWASYGPVSPLLAEALAGGGLRIESEDTGWVRPLITMNRHTRTSTLALYDANGRLLSFESHYEPETPESLRELRGSLAKVRAW